MARYFDEPDENDDGAFISIRFNDIIPQHHPAQYIKRFISLVDISEFEKKYKIGAGKVGRPPKSIRLMLGVILYAIYSRIYSAHKIDTATYTYSDFWFFTHKKRISHDKISKFIIKHEKEIMNIFLETIVLAEKNNLLNFEALFQDGFFMKANASKEKNRTLKGLEKRKEKFHEILEELLSKLKDEELTENQEKLNLKKMKVEKEIEKIDHLKEVLNNRIKAYSQKDCPSEIEDRKKKTCVNLTDKDAELGRNKNHGFDNMYTKVTAIDSEADILVASHVSGHNDEPHIMFPLMKKANVNCSGEYTKGVADAGFNTKGTSVQFEAHGWELIAPTKQHENETRNKDKYRNAIKFEYDELAHCVNCSEGKSLDQFEKYYDSRHGTMMYTFFNKKACAGCKRIDECTRSKKGFKKIKIDSRTSSQQRVLNQYLSESGKKIYKKRSHVAETFQGDLKKNGNFHQLLRRSIDKVRIDSQFHDIVWNLRRIFNSTKGRIVWS
ncbi:MAG: transposase [Spirochaetes bacterium]|nr:transposase [Spirochaetota bacterium]